MSACSRHQSSGERVTYRNGYRGRNLDTRPSVLRACNPEALFRQLFPLLFRVAPAFGKGFVRCGLACPDRRCADDYLAAEGI